MRDDLSRLVLPVLTYALQLKDRLVLGENLVLEREQGTFKGLLLSDLEARRWPDYGGDLDAGPGMGGAGGRPTTEGFLGVRYALVCWLDELFVTDSPWDRAWNEQKLEVALYGTNERAWKFWAQARLAENRPGNDALEVFFIATMLGFRGDLRENPARLTGWVDAVRARLNSTRDQPYRLPPELPPPGSMPPMFGAGPLEPLYFWCGFALLVNLTLGVYLLVRHWGAE